MKQHFTLCIIALVASGLSGCTRGEAKANSLKNDEQTSLPSASTSDNAENRHNVKVKKLEASDLTEYVLAHGTTQAVHEVTYSAEIPGKIEYLSADLGDRVRIGQLLARIDFQTLKAQADQAQSQYDLAKTTFERIQQLRGDELISQQQFDEANSNMRATEAQLAIAKANLAKSMIRASRKGIVSAKFTEKAEYVGPGTRLYTVVDYRTIIVEAMLAETQAAHIQKGAAVNVHITALDKDFQGEVDTVLPTADPASKTFRLRIKIDNPNLEVLVGMSATVRIAAQHHTDVVVVPQSVVIESPQGRYVFVVDKDVARKREVTLGAVEADRVILRRGVSQGETLVVVGQRDLIDGQKVTIIP